MKAAIVIAAITGLFAVGSAAAQQGMTFPDPVNGAENEPFLKAVMPLDEARHLCLDVAGSGDTADVDGPLTMHTCKDSMWNWDERFRVTGEADDLLEMPQYARCVAASSAQAGADLRLVECAPSALTSWRYHNARLTLAAHPELCMTIGAEPSVLTAGGERNRYRNVARSVGVDLCSDAAWERQLFRFDQPLDIDHRLLPAGVTE